MKTNLLTIFAFFFSIAVFGQNNKLNDSLRNAVDEKVSSFIKQKKVPGMAIAMFDEGRISLKKGYGFSNLKVREPITSTTGFNIGSISKLFTAFGVMKLVEDGKIDLDEPIEVYLTRWKLPSSGYDTSKVTIRHLLSHTAGISVHGYPGFINKDALPSLEASLNGKNGPARNDEKVEIILEPQTKFKYSGGGYTILQLIIEEVTKKSFENFMAETIFNPLKMDNSSFDVDKTMLEKSAVPYDENMQELPFEYFTAKAAAGLQTTLEDFVLFVNDILHNHSIVSEKTLEHMLTPTLKSQGVYGLGFRVLKFGPMEFKGHAGSNTGWQSGFFLDFTTKSGLIMMTNGDKGDAVLKNTLKTWATLKYRK
ncbi:serine hydrolase domain-containing protein [Winogradskyella flava]|uniref:Beta-lactamase family protein n=1 Tax=Winogradskyella flava TaxID=1884876 RepID=A0A842IQ38_9FLAO|nr:serine hydrolase domain-containing protein [Winogradskyella flava]MBC2845120.1 beta-lactamase family protein [Winogradskyella flava]